MLYVSIFVELLRSRPAVAVWTAALAQAALWALVPTLFYDGPPGDVATVLAVGHEFRLGAYLGPPLAFWLAEFTFTLAGGRLIGVYALSQICVVITYWTVFALGRSIVGAQHAALAVMLMIGISTFTVPTPNFGPSILAMPLWTIILLHYWWAVGEGRRGYWVALAIEIGLLLLTTYSGPLLIGLLVLFTIATERGRATLASSDPWIACVVAVIVMLPHLLWLADSGEAAISLSGIRAPDLNIDNVIAWLRQMSFIIAAHAGLFVLVALVIGWPWARAEPAPVIVRRPVDVFARQFVYFFAIAPALAATLGANLFGWAAPVGGFAPLVVLSGLAVIVAAGDDIELSHQQAVICGWFGLLLAPPVLTVAAVFALPWIGIDLNINQPAGEIARYFSDSFQRRIGKPLQIVTGDPRTAALVALGSPSRPSLYLHATPERSRWVTLEDIRAKGAIVVWPTSDTAGTVPPAIKERFPDLVPEVPRAFDRRVQGRLPLVRIGWAMIRPQAPREATPSPVPR